MELLQLLVGLVLGCIAITALFFAGATVIYGAARAFGRPLGWFVDSVLDTNAFERTFRALAYAAIVIGVLSYAFIGGGWYLALAGAGLIAVMADDGAFS